MAFQTLLSNLSALDMSASTLPPSDGSMYTQLIGMSGPPAAVAAVLVVATVLYYTLPSLAAPAMDSREPPVLLPYIPWIGHFTSLVRFRMGYFSWIHRSLGEPAVTLPILHKKLYVIFSPRLQQSAMRARSMNPQSFTVDFIPSVFGIKRATLDAMLGRDGVHESLAGPIQQVFHSTLSGDPLDRLALSTLDSVADSLNAVGTTENGAVHASSLFDWIRALMTRATSAGLFGHEHNPYEDPAIMEAQWEFEENMAPLALGVLPSVLARRACRARKAVWAALEPYYQAEHDQDPGASEFVRRRTALWRRQGIPVQEIARNEISIMLAAASNTGPTLFWSVVQAWLLPTSLMPHLRAEVAEALGVPLDRSGRPHDEEIAVDFSRLDAAATATTTATGRRCPLLSSCYREALRLASQIITFRQVQADTLVSDGPDKQYLLRAGGVVMMPAGIVHVDPATWGSCAECFDPRRFAAEKGDARVHKEAKGELVAREGAETRHGGAETRDGDGEAEAEDGAENRAGEAETEERRAEETEVGNEAGDGAGDGAEETDGDGAAAEKLRRAAFVPFGGGRHLCPGRHFAAIEIMAVMAVMALGYDISGLRGKLRMNNVPMVGAAKPMPGFDGGPVVISRRAGWEGVRWKFVAKDKGSDD